MFYLKRMRTASSIFAVVAATLSVGACFKSANKVVPDPTNITVPQAMRDIALGFAEMKATLEQEKRVMGVFVCKATVTFNVTAGGEDNSKLVLDARVSPAPAWEKALLTGHAAGSVDLSSKMNASRGNVVAVEMYSPACIPNNTLGYEKPDQIEEAADAIGNIRSEPGAPPMMKKQ